MAQIGDRVGAIEREQPVIQCGFMAMVRIKEILFPLTP
jgi:hypothetical protein